MSRRLRLPLALVLLLLVGATEGPRLWPALVTAARHIDLSGIGPAMQHAGTAVAGWPARGAELFGWSPLAFAITAGVALVVIIASIALVCWPSRRRAPVRRGSRHWTRRHEVGRLARAGEAVAVIARETRLSQDAVRSLIAVR